MYPLYNHLLGSLIMDPPAQKPLPIENFQKYLDYSHTVLELYNYLNEIVPLTENLERYGIDKSSCPGG